MWQTSSSTWLRSSALVLAMAALPIGFAAEAAEGDAKPDVTEPVAAEQAETPATEAPTTDSTNADLDPEVIARAEAAADLFLAGETDSAEDAEHEAAQAAARAREAEFEALSEEEQRFVGLLQELLTKSEAFAEAGDGRRAGEGFLAVRGELTIIEDELSARMPETVKWLEARVATLAPVLLQSGDLDVPAEKAGR